MATKAKSKRATPSQRVRDFHDADLLLRALLAGLASFDSGTAEFRFNGLRYSCRDCDWSTLVRVIGGHKLQAALTELRASHA